MLFDHFHDIMPGSGIGINYADAERNLTDASLRSQKILDGALDDLSGGIDTARRREFRWWSTIRSRGTAPRR